MNASRYDAADGTLDGSLACAVRPLVGGSAGWRRCRRGGEVGDRDAHGERADGAIPAGAGRIATDLAGRRAAAASS